MDLKQRRLARVIPRCLVMPLTPLDVDRAYNSPILHDMPCSPVTCSSISDLPNEVVDEIAGFLAVASPASPADFRSLACLAITSKRFTLAAQSAMVRNLVLSEPSKVDDLAKLFFRKKHLGRAVRSLDIGVSPSDIPGDVNASSRKRRELERALIGLLPLIKNVRSVTIAAAYDCPTSLIDLLTKTLPFVRSFSLASAFGYSKLVYVSTSSISRILHRWQQLEHLSLTMPWLLEDSKSRPEINTKLRSLEISGFRGEMTDLIWLMGCAQKTLTRFAFDCPLDSEAWTQLAPALAAMSETLIDLSLWSWTYAMPIAEVLAVCKRVQHVSIAAHDCTPRVFKLLPSHLSSLLICSHREFSPLDASKLAEGLESKQSLRSLPRLTLYDPSAHGERYTSVINEPAWTRAKGRGTAVLVTPDPRILGCHITVEVPSRSRA